MSAILSRFEHKMSKLTQHFTKALENVGQAYLPCHDGLLEGTDFRTDRAMPLILLGQHYQSCDSSGIMDHIDLHDLVSSDLLLA